MLAMRTDASRPWEMAGRVRSFCEHSPLRPRDIADRSRSSRDLRRLEPDGFLRETFVLPLHAATATLNGMDCEPGPKCLSDTIQVGGDGQRSGQKD